MRKIISLLSITAVLFAALYTGAPEAKAATLKIGQQPATIERLDNGDYIETVITTEPESTFSLMALRNGKWKTNTKTSYYRNSENKLLWSAAIRATFNYDGICCMCTYDLAIATAPAKTWSIKSKSSTRSGNWARATITATHKTSFVSKDFTKKVTIECNKNGVVS